MGRSLIIPHADFSDVSVLPSSAGYEGLNAIVTTGTQYIDSGVNANNGISIELDVAGFSFESSSSWLCGARHQMNDTVYSFGILADSRQRFYRFDNGDISFDTRSIAVDSPSRTKFYLSNVLAKAGDISISFNRYTFDFNENVYIFNTQKDGVPDASASSVTCYGVKMWSDDILIRDLRPAKRISDNEIGMYDVVNGSFYTNAGIGVFGTL